MKTMETIVETKNLRVEFRAQNVGQARKVAVKDLNLRICAGEVFGFLGPNGAGKTTTMNVLLGFVNATSGAAFLFGVDVREKSRSVKVFDILGDAGLGKKLARLAADVGEDERIAGSVRADVFDEYPGDFCGGNLSVHSRKPDYERSR